MKLVGLWLAVIVQAVALASHVALEKTGMVALGCLGLSVWLTLLCLHVRRP